MFLSAPSPQLKAEAGTSPAVQWLRLHAPKAWGLSLIPGQGIRPHMLQLKIPHAAAKTQCSQINKANKNKYLKNKAEATLLEGLGGGWALLLSPRVTPGRSFCKTLGFWEAMMKPSALTSPLRVASTFPVCCKAHTAFFQEQVPWVARRVHFSSICPHFPFPDLSGTSDSNFSPHRTKFLTRSGAKFINTAHILHERPALRTQEKQCVLLERLLPNLEFPPDWSICTCTFHMHMWSMCFVQARFYSAQAHLSTAGEISRGAYPKPRILWELIMSDWLVYSMFWLGFFPHRDLVAPYLHILGFMADTPSLTQICLILMPATVHSLLPVTASVGSQNSLDKQPGAPGSTYAKSPRWSSRCLFWLLTWCYFFLLDILFPPLFAWLSHSCLKM